MLVLPLVRPVLVAVAVAVLSRYSAVLVVHVSQGVVLEQLPTGLSPAQMVVVGTVNTVVAAVQVMLPLTGQGMMAVSLAVVVRAEVPDRVLAVLAVRVPVAL